MHIPSWWSIIYLAHKHVFNVCIKFFTLNPSGSSKNMSLSISFPWRKSAFTSMVSHFHPFYKNNIQASQTSSFLQICCRFFSSNVVQLILFYDLLTINNFFCKYLSNRYTFLASASDIIKHIVFFQFFNSAIFATSINSWSNFLSMKNAF